jgi:hypothetical protein
LLPLVQLYLVSGSLLLETTPAFDVKPNNKFFAALLRNFF